MAFNAEQQWAIDTYLYTDRLDEGDEPTVALVMTRRQLRFILDAVDHYRMTKCPLKGKGDECAHLAWVENVHTGAIERICTNSCDDWLNSLFKEKIPASLPAKEA